MTVSSRSHRRPQLQPAGAGLRRHPHRRWWAISALAGTLFAGPAFAQDISFQAGTLPKTWTVSGPKCSEVPDFQVHEYNADFYILRQSGCTHHEKPFIYLIFGSDTALLLDTGAGIEEENSTRVLDVVGAVDGVIDQWLKRTGTAEIPLVVAHLHSHGDHTAGDDQFASRPDTTLVKSDVEVMKPFFGITNWPEEIVEYDLGGRILDVISIPGHDTNSMAYYDRRTGLLLTGDSVYPGRVYVNGDPAIFATSHQRLVDFAMAHSVTWVLGTHIEQTRTPYVDYVVGTVYQPDEHPLELGVGVLLEMNEALKAMGDTFHAVRLGEISICGRYPTCDAQTVTVTE